MKFSIKDLSGEIHSIEAATVQYMKDGAKTIEAHFLDAEQKVVAVFTAWHWIKPTTTPPQGVKTK